MSRWVSEEGIELETAPDSPRAVRRLMTGAWDLVLAVLEEEAEEELSWWAEALRACAGNPRLMAAIRRPSMTLVGLAEQLAIDVVRLPLQRDELLRSLRRVRATGSEVRIPLPDVTADPVGPNHRLVGQSLAMLDVYKMIARVATSSASVLLEGESGTGKELVARAIHLQGPRAHRPFVAVNCAAFSDAPFEDGRLGHERGTFTGVVDPWLGRLQQASGGTLFLDGAVDMGLQLQGEILRVLQEGETEWLGGNGRTGVDVRLIASTSRDLRRAVADQRFRRDLYYRLAVVTLRLPRLADRGDDLLLLTAHFVREMGERYGKSVTAISASALERMREHDWVGNVRELRNVIESAVLVAQGDVIRSEHLCEELRPRAGNRTSGLGGQPLALREMEARHIARVIARTEGRVGEAAELLGIHRNTLARKLREHGLR